MGMMDQEKLKNVIANLEFIRRMVDVDVVNDDGVYVGSGTCEEFVQIIDEAIELLKKQEPKPYQFLCTMETIIGTNEETGELNTFDVYKCPNCEMEVTYAMAKSWHLCPECGQAVRWE